MVLLMLAAVLTLETVRKATGTLAIEPAILLVEMLTGLLGLGYTLTLGPLRHRPARDAESERLRAARVIGTLARVLFAAGAAWTVLGYLPLAIRSELAAAVYDAGQAAGISFPFPQREVRLLQDPPVRPNARPVP
jgi:small-conductance mechanosensitive channel